MLVAEPAKFERQSTTGAPLVAERWSASSARAWPTASSRPSRSSPSPRIAAATLSRASRSEAARSPSLRSPPVARPQRVRARALDVDPLGAPLAPQPDAGREDVPRVGPEERAPAGDRLD